MVNSWMDAPSRRFGAGHRTSRHDKLSTPLEACQIYGDAEYAKEKGTMPPSTEKNCLIAAMVLQHLKLDGLITPKEAENLMLEDIIKEYKQRQENERQRKERLKQLEAEQKAQWEAQRKTHFLRVKEKEMKEHKKLFLEFVILFLVFLIFGLYVNASGNLLFGYFFLFCSIICLIGSLISFCLLTD